MPRNVCVMLLACLFALGATGQAFAANLLTSIDACLSRVQHAKQASKRSEKVTLSDSCPELSLALDDPAFAHLEPALEDETTLGQLRDAQRSLRSIHSSPKNQHTLALDNLHQILKQTYTPEKIFIPPENPIDKLLDWIGKKISDYFKQDNWIKRNFHIENNISKSTIKGILNFSILLLVVIVLFIIFNELRAASVFSLLRRRRGAQHHLHQHNNKKQDLSSVNLNDISALPVHAQIPTLLRYTLQRLIDRKILPYRYNLTNQEFLNILRETMPDACQYFQLLVNCGERVIYGNKTITASEAEQLLERAHRLEQLQSKAKR